MPPRFFFPSFSLSAPCCGCRFGLAPGDGELDPACAASELPAGRTVSAFATPLSSQLRVSPAAATRLTPGLRVPLLRPYLKFPSRLWANPFYHTAKPAALKASLLADKAFELDSHCQAHPPGCRSYMTPTPVCTVVVFSKCGEATLLSRG